MIRKLFIFLMLLFLVSGCAGLQSISKPEQGAMSSDRLMDMLAGSEVNKVRAFTTHTGGGLGALDKIATANLSDGDISFVITGGKEYVYVFDAAGSDAEDTVDFKFIRPDDFGAAGVWDLLSRSAIGYTMAPSADPSWEFMDSESPGTDKSTAWIKAIYVDGADGSENGDIFIEVIKGGAENTEVLRYDESDDRWETTQGLQMAGALTIEGAINLGTGGVVMTDDADGALTILGAGDGFNESLTFNFDDTENTVGVTSGTAVGLLDFGTINLATDNLDLSEGPITNVSDIAVNSISDNDNNGFTIASAGSTVTVESVVFTGGAMTGITSIGVTGGIIATGIADGLTNVTITTDGSEEANPTDKMSHYIINKHATEATAMDVNLPATAVVGMQLVVKNGWGDDAVTTGVITIFVPATHYAWNPYTKTQCAQGYDLVSGGAAGDFIGMVAIDTNTWESIGFQGVWTCTVTP